MSVCAGAGAHERGGGARAPAAGGGGAAALRAGRHGRHGVRAAARAARARVGAADAVRGADAAGHAAVQPGAPAAARSVLACRSGIPLEPRPSLTAAFANCRLGSFWPVSNPNLA